MNIKFFREKNALSIKNAKIVNPSKDELNDFLIKKLIEKANHIETIYDNQLRNNYLKKKDKFEIANKHTEEYVKKFLAQRLSVDLFQLLNDMCLNYDIKINFDNNKNLSYNELEIRENILKICEDINGKKAIYNKMKNLLNLFVCYLKIYNLSLKTIKANMIEVENKEGNFYNGKIVIMEE